MYESIFGIKQTERKETIVSFFLFFFVLSSYYILRPVRDEMGVAGGHSDLQWSFTATFIVMCFAVPAFGWLSKKYSRRVFIPFSYVFFALNLLIFYFYFGVHPNRLWAQIFFVWVSVFNLYIVSIFWGLMSDIFSPEASRRLFGIIASGGSAGAIFGPLITSMLVKQIGIRSLLLVSIILLFCAVTCVMTLLNLSNRKIITGGNDLSDVTKELVNNKLSEGIFFGVTRVIREPYLRNIALFTFFSTCIATVLYFHQAQLVSAYSDDPIKRTALFANIDLVVNIITVIFQIIIVGRVAKKSGVIYLLVLVPLLVAIGLVCISYMPFIETILIIQIINRAGSHGLVKPGREMLYSILCREDKYKTKTVIDTVVYRGGDALSGWLYGGLKMCSLSIIGISIATLPVALLCIMMGLYLSDKYSKHTKNN